MKVEQFLAFLLEKGVAEFVVCAGARNACLVEGLVRLEQTGAVTLWRHFEERSAGFFALGRTMATAQPCAVVTTSGTAAAELLPATIEARHQARPLVLITADRPRRFRGSGAPQTIEQAGLFGCHAEGCDDIEPETDSGTPAVMAGWSGRAPWHVNVCLEESASCESVPAATAVPFRPQPRRIDVSGLVKFLRGDMLRGLTVFIGGLEPADREDAFHFANDLGAPVVAEATSGLREALAHLALPDADRLLRERQPGRILRLGDVPSGRFWRDLEDLPDIAVCSVTRSGFPGIARPSTVVVGEVAQVLAGMGAAQKVGDVAGHLRPAARRHAWIEEMLEAFPASEPALVRTVSVYASLASSVFLGNSLPLREWNLFAQWQRPVPNVRANRGANGIDGQLSTWLGWTARSGDTWVVAGDLTTLYDLAAPAVSGQVANAGRVLCVINNNGGRIFDRLPRLQAMPERAREWMINPHGVRLAGWASLWGMAHLQVTNAEDFDALDEMPRPVVVEVLPDPAQTAAFWRQWDRAVPT